ncbi:MAG: glycosyltransferase family 87 protein [Phycisphaerae bacterium]
MTACPVESLGGDRRATPGGRRRSRVAAIGPALLFFAAWLIVADYHVRWRGCPYDDAFITYRHARNLIAGGGLVFNPGERVLGCSAPLFALYCAGVGAVSEPLGVPLPDAVVSLNGLWFGLVALALATTVRRQCGPPAGWLAGTALLLSRGLFNVSIGGMESSLFTALVLWSWIGLTGSRPRTGALLAGLAGITRPEGLLALPLAGWLAISRRERVGLRRTLPLLVAPGVLWAAFALAYYGDLVPQSLRAKAAPIYPYTLHEAADAWSRVIVSHFFPRGAELAGRVACGGLLLAAAVGAWRLRRRAPLVTAAFVFCAGCWALYVASASRPVPWYRTHLLVPLSIAVLAPLLMAARRLRLDVPHRSPLRATAALVLLAAACELAGLHPWAAVRTLREPARAAAPNSRVLDYRRVAEALDGALPADATLLAPEVGALGYYCHQRILDACGLVSPEALPYLPVPAALRGGRDVGAIPPAMVADLRPDYVVTLPGFAQAGLLRQAWFSRAYAPRWRFALHQPVWGNAEVVVYARIAPAAAAQPGTAVTSLIESRATRN